MTKKRFGFILAFALICILIVGISPTKASAACDHEFQYDECIKCGYMRIHKCKHSLLFIARYNGDDAPRCHEAPRGSSKCVTWPKAGERLYVIARTRNKHGNLWLKVAGNSYIWSEYVAFDYDATVAEACKGVHWLVSSSEWYIYMFAAFKNGGSYDLKEINMLGLNAEYYVYSNGIIQSRKSTGHELGNILYGSVCSRYDRTFEDAIHCAAWADFRFFPNTPAEKEAKENWRACWKDLEYSRCDKADDRQLVYLGYWIEANRSSNSCVPWKYDVVSPY